MAIIALRAWYLAEYEPLETIEQRPHDLRLSKNSLLKTALRADFLDDAAAVKESLWFQRYLQGEPVEFYIEGSGSYLIANIDLISHEIYFVKQDTLAHLEPTIFFCSQTELSDSSDQLRWAIQAWLTEFNPKSRLELTLVESHRLSDGPIRLQSTLAGKLRRSLVFIADVSPISYLDTQPPVLIPSPKVSVEVGYALHCKHQEQILLAQMERPQWPGQFPVDLPSSQRLSFADSAELAESLTPLLLKALAPFKLFH
ncbi:hypothetical protein [Synechococcus sp. PCC 6312]|uniref:hypothetical protein n=1 Tax=Synechococcus sp. (strain ATCC 27167 / PCC 6312) TaxID=195253 RepID=UPI00029F2653|nr:hypothetical protein [Synechococcus sp. PCC 6312]AFY60755.1 hypothetical protein Syn6312_1594 [Synechococcus sp. PCC 6312]